LTAQVVQAAMRALLNAGALDRALRLLAASLSPALEAERVAA